MSRAYTMVLALLLLNTLMAVLSLLVARSRRTTLALRQWGWGALAYSAGLGVTMMNFLGAPVSKVVGNALIAYAPIPMIAGVLLHTRYRLPMRWVWGAFVVTVAMLAGNYLRTQPWAFVNYAAPAILSNSLFLGAGIALLLSPPKDAKLPARLLAVTCLFAAFIWTVRVLVLWLYLGPSPDRERADLIVSLFVIAQLVIAVGATLSLVWIEQRNMEAELERIAYEDPLTRLLNRRATLMRFEDELVRAARNGENFGMLVMDVDHFKRFNDTYGHQAGDAVLAHVAGTLGASKRPYDVLGRIGGEEFLLVLSGLAGDGAAEAANRVRERVGATPLSYFGRELTVTVSGGLALYPADGTTWDELFSTADRRLYDAKHGGRNRVVGPNVVGPNVEQCQSTS